MSPSKELRTLHIEEDIMGVFYLYILPSKNAGETIINVKRDNITRICFSVFPNISQYTYDSFVPCTETPQRVLENETSVAHVDKNWWSISLATRNVNYPSFACSSEFLGKSSKLIFLFVTIIV